MDQNILNGDVCSFCAISVFRIVKDITKAQMKRMGFPVIIHLLHLMRSMSTLWTMASLFTQSHINLKDRTTIYLNPKKSLKNHKYQKLPQILNLKLR